MTNHQMLHPDERLTFTHHFALWVVRFVERAAVVMTIGVPSLIVLVTLLASLDAANAGRASEILTGGIIVSAIAIFGLCLFFATFFVLVEIADNTGSRG